MAFSKPRIQDAVSPTKLLRKSILGLAICIGAAVCAQAQNTQVTRTHESWTATAQTSEVNNNPFRTSESHVEYGNRTVDKWRVEVLGPDGRYQPDSDTEKETIQINATMTRTVERTYRWDGNGQRKLAQVTQEEARSSASGDAQVVRTISNSDVNGNIQIVQREVTDRKKISPDAQETKTVVYVGDGNGGFAASSQTQELQKRGADHKVEMIKTTLLPDGNGNWEVGEVKETTIKDEDKKRTTEEQVSLPNSEGRLSDFSRTIVEEIHTRTGERSSIAETHSTFVPGVAGDGRLHLNQVVTTVQKKDSDRETTEQQVEQPNPGNPNVGLQISTRTKYIVQYGASGTEQTKTVQARDINGTFNVISVETRKSDQVPPAEVVIASSGEPR